MGRMRARVASRCAGVGAVPGDAGGDRPARADLLVPHVPRGLGQGRTRRAAVVDRLHVRWAGGPRGHLPPQQAAIGGQRVPDEVGKRC